MNLITKPSIRIRQQGKIANTNYVNEVAEQVLKIGQPPVFGQRDDGGSAVARNAVRLKIVTAKDVNNVAVCNTWDGAHLGGEDIPVRVVRASAVGDELWAVATLPDSGVTYSGLAVTWLEVLHDLPSGTMPVPTAQYQVLQVSSYTNSTTYTLIFDYPRSH